MNQEPNLEAASRGADRLPYEPPHLTTLDLRTCIYGTGGTAEDWTDNSPAEL